MATKPTTTPGWTKAGKTPTAGKKAAGFADAERPPAPYFNWFLTLISSWIDYVKEQTNFQVSGAAGHGTGITYGAAGGSSGGDALIAATTSVAFYSAPAAWAGRVLTGCKVSVTDNATGTTKVTGQLYQAASGHVILGGEVVSAQSSGAGAFQTLTLSGTTFDASGYTVASGTGVVLEVTVNANNLCTIHEVEWIYE